MLGKKLLLVVRTTKNP